MDKFKLITLNRHRFATDGNGITTLVALAGCPLKCEYCINNSVLKNGKIKEFTEKELIADILIDYCYFIATGGGVTFGGGEPLLQSEMIIKFIDILPPGIKVNIETSLNTDNEFIEDLINKVDTLIVDIKSMSSVLYKKYTGINNENTLKWLKFIVDNNLQHKCIIRIPSIPNYTTKSDIEESIKIIGEMGFSNIDTFDYVIMDIEESL